MYVQYSYTTLTMTETALGKINLLWIELFFLNKTKNVCFLKFKKINFNNPMKISLKYNTLLNYFILEGKYTTKIDWRINLSKFKHFT